ncbi:MAG: hypothetical protein IPP63_17235 [Chloracidobacterium sp.]|nr:hypothetical protein [Chloracidobacterium sp.]
MRKFAHIFLASNINVLPPNNTSSEFNSSDQRSARFAAEENRETSRMIAPSGRNAHEFFFSLSR